MEAAPKHLGHHTKEMEAFMLFPLGLPNMETVAFASFAGYNDLAIVLYQFFTMVRERSLPFMPPLSHHPHVKRNDHYYSPLPFEVCLWRTSTTLWPEGKKGLAPLEVWYRFCTSKS